MQGVECDHSHQVLVLWTGVAEYRQEIVERLSYALVLRTGGLEVGDYQCLEQLGRDICVGDDAAEQQFRDCNGSHSLHLGGLGTGAEGFDVNLHEGRIVDEKLRAMNVEDVRQNVQRRDLERRVALAVE